MVNWLIDYVVGCALAMLVVGLIAIKRRKSNDMGRRALVQLTVSAGLVWPFVAIAGIQAVVLLMLKLGLGLLRGGSGDAEPAVVPPMAIMEAVVPAQVAAVA